MRYSLFSPRPASNVCVSNEYDENMWIMTPMFCLLCYDSGLVVAQYCGRGRGWLRPPRLANGSEVEGRSQARMTSNSSTDPGLAPASALPLLLLGVRSDPAVIVEISTVQIDF